VKMVGGGGQGEDGGGGVEGVRTCLSCPNSKGNFPFYLKYNKTL
jgi:hypothetical protein